MYDVIVVGGGHAGCEASYACSKIGKKTLLVTSNIKNIADMPCNPSIGGTAKGIVVREIDALGGIMGKIADKSHFQIKMLNSKKGPAVRSLRAQIDKKIYPKLMLKELQKQANLQIIEAMVEDLIIENGAIKGIIMEDNTKIYAKAVILTTGTYLRSQILIGSKKTPGGPHGEKESKNLSNKLKQYGFEIQRLKTGTPPRIDVSTVNLKDLTIEEGDKEYYTFSFDNSPFYNINEQEKCYLVYTNANTHKIIRENLSKSSMYGGYVEGVGPRYCPSIEDKIVRFSDKERHQLFLEPESKENNEWYLQGFSTSMPYNIQEKMVHSLKGFENAKIIKYAYAIEYDALNPLQLKPSLETKIISNLFTAGQINGTSGYEEAACQGLIAGINACLKLDSKEPLVLKRNEAYIGVLIDDLVTKGTQEPYRLLTSRAEYRLILRNDNADRRLRKYGYQVGLISDSQYKKIVIKEKNIKAAINKLSTSNLKLTKEVIEVFKENNIEIPTFSISMSQLLKRPEIHMDFIKKLIDLDFSDEILDQVSIEIKYEGYIAKTYKEVEKLLNLESKKIPDDIDYDKILNLASEAKQKLKIIKPATIAQATRISGVNPADISVLSIYLKKEYGKNE